MDTFLANQRRAAHGGNRPREFAAAAVREHAYPEWPSHSSVGEPSMMTLEHELTYRLKVRGPLGTTEGSPIGARQYWEMSEATLTGPRINAKLGMPGGVFCTTPAWSNDRPRLRRRQMRAAKQPGATSTCAWR
jgi:hypothetical protein